MHPCCCDQAVCVVLRSQVVFDIDLSRHDDDLIWWGHGRLAPQCTISGCSCDTDRLELDLTSQVTDEKGCVDAVRLRNTASQPCQMTQPWAVLTDKVLVLPQWVGLCQMSKASYYHNASGL